MRERGSALLVSVVAISILLLISGVFFSSVIAGYRVETSEDKGFKAYYLAEAGIQYGRFQVLNQSPSASVTQTIVTPYKGEFTVEWRIVDPTLKIYEIKSLGTYSGTTRTLKAQYTRTSPTP